MSDEVLRSTVDLAIDVGGTFTDLVARTVDGSLVFHKELNAGGDQHAAVIRAVEVVLAELDLAWSDVGLIVHGTTISTNTVLTGDGARVGLLTTKGFRDALALRRGRRSDLYNNKTHRPPSLVPRSLRLGVAERILSDGSILEPLETQSLEAALKETAAAGVESIAICFMHSYCNPEHEEMAADQISTNADLSRQVEHVSVSSNVASEIGFYERTSTTVLDAFIAPKVTSYLSLMGEALETHGFTGTCNIMQANAGASSLEAASKVPIRTLNSGPTGGANCGGLVASWIAVDDCITFDMGGTSCDVCLVLQGRPSATTESEIAGHHLQMRATDIVTIGAGGGSVLKVGRDQLLRVGPESAGADPGPACYGRGGEQATVTDVDLLLGLLDEHSFYGGRLRLDRHAATKALTAVANQLDATLSDVAQAAQKLVNAAMANAVREVSIFRGRDPHQLPLIVGGGAGPLHACEVARMLEIPLVVMPNSASVFSALGLLASDVRYDRSRVVGPVPLEALDPKRAETLFHRLEEAGLRELEAASLGDSVIRFERSVDLRYEGQFQTITVPCHDMDNLHVSLRRSFVDSHRSLFGYAYEENPVDVLTLRSTAVGVRERIGLRGDSRFVSAVRLPIEEESPSGIRRIPVQQLTDTLEGPLLLLDPYWTGWIPEGFVCARDPFDNVLAAPIEQTSMFEEIIRG